MTTFIRTITGWLALATSGLLLTHTPLAAEFTLPKFEQTRLPNGLTVYLMERHNTPLLTVAAVVKAGAVADGKQAGLAQLTNEAMRLGSKQFGKEQIDQTFDFKGAQLGNSASTEQSMLYFDGASADQDTLLPMLANMLQEPLFDSAELDKLRERKIANVKRGKEAPRNVAQAYWGSMLFGNAPYANPAIGTEKSLSALNVEQVRQFHQTWYRPDNSALIVVGDFQATAMRDKLAQLFGNWPNPAGALPVPGATGQVQADQARVWLVNKADSHETTFLFGGKGIARNDPDYVPLQVINTVLGGRFTSWLNDELRVNSGLTYGASSNFSTLSQAGSFAVSSFTATEKTAAALDLAQRTYQKLWDKGIDAATLASAKAYVKGQFPPRFETNQQLALLLGTMYVNALGREQFDRFTRDIDSLTPERSRQLIKQHFPREKLQMLLIGKAEAIRDTAAKYGKVTELDIKADGFAPQP
jgi:predicted Zn-dependent peptidase